MYRMFEKRLACFWLAMVMVLQIAMPVWAVEPREGDDTTVYYVEVTASGEDTNFSTDKEAIEDSLVESIKSYSISTDGLTINPTNIVGAFLTSENGNRNYAVSCWYSDEECSNEVTTGVSVSTTESEPTKFYVKVQEFLMVTLALNGGKFSNTSIENNSSQVIRVPVGKKISEDLDGYYNVPVHDYATFSHWTDTTTGDTWEVDSAVTSGMTIQTVWTPNTVTFDTNDTSITLADDNKGSFVYTTGIATAPDMTSVTPPTGKTFLGWAYEEDATASDVVLTTAIPTGKFTSGTLTLYAVWGAEAVFNSFDVKLNVPMGDTGASSDVAITYNVTNDATTLEDILTESASELTAPTGYVLDGWYSDEDYTSSKVDVTKTLTSDGTTDFYGQWVEETPTTEYTVTFNGNNNQSETVSGTVNDDGYLVELTETQFGTFTIPEGKEFDEWNTSADGTGTTWTFSSGVSTTEVEADTILYAIWKNKESTTFQEFEVTFIVAKSATDEADNLEITYKVTEDGTLLSTVIAAVKGTVGWSVPDGYELDGWYSSTVYTSSKVDETQKLTSETTFYGQWVEKTTTFEAFDVTLIVADSSDGAEDGFTIVYEVEDDVTTLSGILEANEEKWEPADGFYFDGWYKSETYTSANKVSPTEESAYCTEAVTYYARWVELDEVLEPFEVTLEISALPESSAGAGDGESKRTLSYESEAAITLSNVLTYKLTDTEKNQLNLLGYTLDGWYTDSAYTKEADLDAVLTEDVTYYARWTLTVYFELNNGTYDNGSTVSGATFFVEGVIPNSKVSKPEGTVSRTGYNFMGWYLKNGSSYSSSDEEWDFDTDTAHSNMNLYAKWDQIRMRTVTIDLQGGSIEGLYSSKWEESVEIGYTVTDPGMPVLFGYEFTGWMADTDGDTSNDVEWTFATDTVTEAVTIYATWAVETEDPVISVQVTTAPITIDYKEGETFDPTGLVLYAITAEGRSETVTYSSQNSVLFSFYPSLTTELSTSNTAVTVTYKGCVASIPITVTEVVYEYYAFGTVRDSAGNAVQDATVRLYSGNSMISGGSYVTNESGYFEFKDVTAGYYNITVNYGYRSRNFLVYLPGATYQFADIYLPAGNVSSRVEVNDSSVGYVFVEGMDDVATYLSTNEALSDILSVSLEFSECTEYYDQEYINAYKGEYDLIADFFDISIYKNLTFVTSESYVRMAITDVEPMVRICIDIPEAYQGMESYAVYRMHNGAMEKLTSTTVWDPSSVTEECITVNSTKTQVTIYTRKFCTYALAYTNRVEDSEDTGDSQVEDYRYTISLQKTVNGVFTSDTTVGGTFYLSDYYPIHGTKVTIYPTLYTGFVIGEITVEDISGNRLEVVNNGNGTYFYTQGTSAVTLTVAYTNPELPVTPDGYQGFFDVNIGDWYYDHVIKAAHLGLMAGVGYGMFNPEGTTTRGMIVQILYNLSGSPEISQYSGFSDVNAYMYYAKAVNWAKSYGVVYGYADGTFRPDDYITREELAIILFSYAEYSPEVTPILWPFAVEYGDEFAISPWALNAVTWCTNKGVFTGKGANLFMPSEYSTRAEVATCILALIGESV